MSAPEISPPAPVGGGSPIGGSGTAGYVAKFTGGTSIGNSLVRDNGTDVSIDMSPSVGFKLSVNGDTNIVGRIDAVSSRISTMSSGLSNDLVLQRDGVEAARIIAGGLLGVGCTDPGNTLETYASTASGIRASSDTLANIGIFQNSSNATGASLTLRKAGGTRAAPSAVTSGDTIGTVQFSAYGTGGNVVSSIAANVVAYTSATNISSNLTFGTSPSGSAAAVTRMTLNSSGAMIMAGDGTAAAPVIANSTGVSGLYFPSSATAAIAANGAVAATFSKVAGAGVALGGTTGLVFDASGTQQGVKLTATPGSANVQTLDAYNENTSWSPTVTWGTGGTVTTTSATGAYTQIGNVVTFTVTIAYNSSVVPTGGSVTMDLPRPSATGFNQRPGTWAFNAWNGAAGTFFLSIGSNSSTATLRVANGTGTADVAANMTVTASGALVVTATYLAS
jgi:hypothetical protein